MNKLYLYNEPGNTLHIKDFCAKANGPDLIPFDSEDEALAYAGRRMGMCKNCMDKRDEILLEYLSNKLRGDKK